MTCSLYKNKKELVTVDYKLYCYEYNVNIQTQKTTSILSIKVALLLDKSRLETVTNSV